MTRPMKTMAELRKLTDQAGMPATTTNAPPGATAALATPAVQQHLRDQVGTLDLGWWGNLRARSQQNRADGEMQKTLIEARAQQATALMLERLSGEVELIRTSFRIDFSDRYASLAENAAASQITVLRKLRALEMEARNLVHVDLKRELDDLQQMLADGVIDDTSFQQEVSFRFQRYEDLKADFARTMNEYQATVQNTYRAGQR
ncbi:hypothetical protein KAK07_11855 [Ideonella sp. 4Y16]|uniref:hypothetical protein n=1 Tax=Ideonella alba TaxID=2824118 RepID=UPI001B383E3D|nr:hypothetical protein [Ideonella alba]MBQ0944029.1 hypothetical protein [Ideonella alba]